MSDSLQPHGLQHARPANPSPTPGACSNSCPLSQWCHPTVSSSVIPFSSLLQSFPASGSFLMSWLLASGGQSIGASASVLPVNIQGWFPLGLPSLICVCCNLPHHYSIGGPLNYFQAFSCFSCSVMSDSATPWTVAHQAPLSMGFSRQEYWSGLQFPSPEDLPDPGIEPVSAALAGGFFTSWATKDSPPKL